MRTVTRAILALVLAAGAAGCATLPPHVWMPVPRVQGVDLFYWTLTHQCTMRVVAIDSGGDWYSYAVQVNESICTDALRGR